MPVPPTHKTVTSVSYQAIYAAIDRIPEGRVATYGQVASLAGLPGRARLVGYALNALAGRSAIPWHRVVNAQGRVSPRSCGSDADIEQRLRLEHEGVHFDAGDRIPLDRFLWRPQLAGKGVLFQHEEK
jgi:methylated-DNA-protein-cysteine methyltransferase-like protein